MGSNSANKDLLARAWAAYDKGDEAGFVACLTPDWKEHDLLGNTGDLADERRTMREHRVAFPDKHTEIVRMVADDEYVACECVVTATHSGKYLDLDPTGKRVMMHEMMINRVRDGRLAETWAVVVEPGFYEQLAGRSPPKGLDNMG